jgi:ubiquinone/menaquinone biosynthesis C-methylase UbiE
MRDKAGIMTATAPGNFWDALVPAYERWADPCSALFAEAVLERAGLRAGSAVLDVAAGTGALADAAARRGHRVRAIDSSPGMVHSLTERLQPFPGCSATLMDALNLDYRDGEFDAAFSMFGVMYFGTETAKSLAEMVRVVRPAGIVGVVHWAVPEGAPYFTILGRAVNRFDDPEVGQFAVPLSENLKRSELEDALGKAGCVDARSESVQVDCPMPAPETFMAELDPFFQNVPQYLAAVSRDRSRFQAILIEEARLAAAKENGLHLARANFAYGRVA